MYQEFSTLVFNRQVVCLTIPSRCFLRRCRFGAYQIVWFLHAPQVIGVVVVMQAIPQINAKPSCGMKPNGVPQWEQ
ncbi:MAG TPA: hypothetical protein DEF47_21735 [Herpetosiphon sp.]|nr:hypothetical protein [Herpetosiphon sp.]